MAHESFEDKEVADLLNKHYIAIKVDREERPDIDSVYMKVCQMMAGHGGWPLTIIMTPDKVPFYAGTYFPKDSKYGIPGMIEMLTQLHKKYNEDPDHITDVTKRVRNALERTVQTKSSERLTSKALDEAYVQLKRNFSFEHGGFGEAPKFPQPQNMLFLLRYYYYTGKRAALEMVEQTLQAMAAGGIYDHVGFGFARYSTDEEWIVPHFEKMLYDNALLLMVYTECYQVTKNPFYQKISDQIITFVLREMIGEEGGFYSAIDADSEGTEGKYYVWDFTEIHDVLGKELGDLYTEAYNITTAGNFAGKNILNQRDINLETIAFKNNLSLKQLEQKLEVARKKLLLVREQRAHPHVDDKVLTAWNGLMIAALAKAGKVFNNATYLTTAKTAMQFVEEKLYQNGRLMARFRDGQTKYKAYLDDYAFLLWAYVELYHTTFSLDYLTKGKNLLKDMLELFWDDVHGGFYFSGKDGEQLIAGDKEVYDGALPSGNSVAAVMLVQMAYLTGETSYLDKVEEMYYTFFADINRQASASPFFLQSLLLTENPSKEVVVLGKENDSARHRFITTLQQRFSPETTVLVAESANTFAPIAPFAAEYRPLENKTTIYICENFTCQQPTTDVSQALLTITENK